ncbi:alpha/beta hydrolase [Reyranella sp.]|uniref:alpha/beta fold hydrolase n=1 Tax=Reyranella sp. TaxID=1929291 RepID=UPI003417EE37
MRLKPRDRLVDRRSATPRFGTRSSQGCAVAIAFAARHPEKVSHLILHGGFALGPLKRTPEETERTRAMMQLMKAGWGTDNPAFRQMFTSLFFPEGTKEIFDSFNELQRASISSENAIRFREVVGNIDVRDLLSKLKIPTLVTHSRGDAIVPWEYGRAMASEIPGARFVTLQSKNHILLDSEPAHERLLEEVREFLKS